MFGVTDVYPEMLKH